MQKKPAVTLLVGIALGVAVGSVLAVQWWLLRQYLANNREETEPPEHPGHLVTYDDDDPDWDPAIDEYLAAATS